MQMKAITSPKNEHNTIIRFNIGAVRLLWSLLGSKLNSLHEQSSVYTAVLVCYLQCIWILYVLDTLCRAGRHSQNINKFHSINGLVHC